MAAGTVVDMEAAVAMGVVAVDAADMAIRVFKGRRMKDEGFRRRPLGYGATRKIKTD
jgi:hypothetical protein